MLVPVPKVYDLKAFNTHFLKQCDEDMLRPHYSKQHLHKELLAGDRKALLSLLSVAFDESELKVVCTDSYAKFTLNKAKHTYSAAPSLRLESSLCDIDSARGYRSRQGLPRDHMAFAALR